MNTPGHVAAFLAGLTKVKASGSGWSACCPAHDDKAPSLSVRIGKGDRLLLKCHAGCSEELILSARRLTPAALWPEKRKKPDPDRFEFCNRAGDLVAVHVRLDQPGTEKRFWWERPGGLSGLGGLPVSDLPLFGVESLDTEEGPAIITEGEKAANMLANLHPLTLGTGTGASSIPGRKSLEDLQGRDVFLWPDNDPPGREHMRRIGAELEGIAKSVRVIIWGTKKGDDAADFIMRGGSRESLAQLCAKAQAFPGPLGPTSSLTATPPAAAAVVCLADVAPEPVRWLWPGRLAFGKLIVLDGDPGLGKSTLTLDIAARLTTGRPLPTSDITLEPGAVLFATAEDGAGDTIRPRFDAAGGDPSRFFLYEGTDGGGLSLPGDVQLLETEVRRLGVRFVVLDPLSAFLSEKTDTFKDASVRRALAPLAKMAERTSASVLVVRHLNKGGGSDPLYRGQGSIGIIGAVRIGLLLGPHPENENLRVLAVSKSNIAKKASSLAFQIEAADQGEIKTSRLAWLGPTEHSAAQLVAPAESVEDRSARDEAAEFLRAELAAGPVDAKRIKERAREENYSEATLRRARVGLGIKPKKSGMSGPWVWELPAGKPTPLAAEDAH